MIKKKLQIKPLKTIKKFFLYKNNFDNCIWTKNDFLCAINHNNNCLFYQGKELCNKNFLELAFNIDEAKININDIVNKNINNNSFSIKTIPSKEKNGIIFTFIVKNKTHKKLKMNFTSCINIKKNDFRLKNSKYLTCHNNNISISLQSKNLRNFHKIQHRKECCKLELISNIFVTKKIKFELKIVLKEKINSQNCFHIFHNKIINDYITQLTEKTILNIKARKFNAIYNKYKFFVENFNKILKITIQTNQELLWVEKLIKKIYYFQKQNFEIILVISYGQTICSNIIQNLLAKFNLIQNAYLFPIEKLPYIFDYFHKNKLKYIIPENCEYTVINIDKTTTTYLPANALVVNAPIENSIDIKFENLTNNGILLCSSQILNIAPGNNKLTIFLNDKQKITVQYEDKIKYGEYKNKIYIKKQTNYNKIQLNYIKQEKHEYLKKCLSYIGRIGAFEVSNKKIFCLNNFSNNYKTSLIYSILYFLYNELFDNTAQFRQDFNLVLNNYCPQINLTNVNYEFVFLALLHNTIYPNQQILSIDKQSILKLLNKPINKDNCLKYYLLAKLTIKFSNSNNYKNFLKSKLNKCKIIIFQKLKTFSFINNCKQNQLDDLINNSDCNNVEIFWLWQYILIDLLGCEFNNEYISIKHTPHYNYKLRINFNKKIIVIENNSSGIKLNNVDYGKKALINLCQNPTETNLICFNND